MSLLKKLNRTKNLLKKVDRYQEDLDLIKVNQGRILAEMYKSRSNMNEAEFKVFSQWGEDGIIQFLLNKIGNDCHKSFIEFGVENFTESNCRFLLINDLWKGLIIDGSQNNIDYIKKDNICWRYPLTPVCAFIKKDNINDLIKKAGFGGRVGILSVDIDGNDYWVLENIDVEADILITEYNSIFGDKAKVSVPYDPDFQRTSKHYSNLYWGASLGALNYLADKKGYFLVGCNTNGNNAFFMNKKFAGKLVKKEVSEVFRDSSFRESRDRESVLTFLDRSQGLSLLRDLQVTDVETMKSVSLAEIR